MTRRRFVFIVAHARSGSTLLQNVLNQAPDFHIAGENWDALLGLYESCRSVTYSKHSWGKNPTLSSSPWFGADRLDPISYAKQLTKVFVSEVIRPPKDAKVIGFKEVRYADNLGLLLNYLEFIKHCFAPAKFILNTRDAEATANSRFWGATPKDKVVERVRSFEAVIDQFHAENPEISYRARYEEFTTDEEKLSELLDFVNARIPVTELRKTLSQRLVH